ncbi:MAG: hypothetical protein J6328_07125 [Bacilli bacterium]|nr:hypothetical protein [Bacilli bacterium]
MINLFLLLSPFCFGALAYWLSNSLYIAISIAIIFLFSFFTLLKPWLLALQEKRRKRKESFHFISSFVISLALTGSLDKSFEGAISDANGDFAEVLKGVEKETIRDKLLYLANYFDMESYRMFLSLFSLYEDQGGDLLDVSKGLLDELTRIEESENAIEKEGKASMREYLVMWVISLGIFAFLRIGLANFYDALEANPFFLASISVFFAFFLGSLLFYFYVYAGKPVLRRKKNEG